MRRVGFVTHPDCDLHELPGHPESSIRTTAIKEYFDETGLADSLVRIEAQEADATQVALAHDPAYVESVRSRVNAGARFIDLDTYVTRHSYQAALLSYGGTLMAVAAVLDGELDRAFCCLRPPGHHAGYDYSKGFCIFNNIAGAARLALKESGLRRVAIFDFDGHHGNGTQDIFYEDGAVHYTSLHQYPFYPGTGAADERGSGPGAGSTLNLALPAGCSGRDAIELVRTQYLPAMEAFQPQLLLISAGFDAHRLDPLVMLDFEIEDYGALTRLLTSLAGRYADGRIVSVLEGGYDLDVLAHSAYEHVKGLLSDD